MRGHFPFKISAAAAMLSSGASAPPMRKLDARMRKHAE